MQKCNNFIIKLNIQQNIHIHLIKKHNLNIVDGDDDDDDEIMNI